MCVILDHLSEAYVNVLNIWLVIQLRYTNYNNLMDQKSEIRGL